MLKNKFITVILTAFILVQAGPVRASVADGEAGNVSPAAVLLTPAALKAQDMPYDKGGSVILSWDRTEEPYEELYWRVFLSSSEAGGWLEALSVKAAEVKPSSDMALPFWAWKGSETRSAVSLDLTAHIPDYRDGKDLRFLVLGTSSFFSPGMTDLEDLYASTGVQGSSRSNWFRLDRLNNLIMVLMIAGVFIWAVLKAKSGNLFIRRIAGLDAIEEAIGRATEMGKPIFYMIGIGPMSHVSTIASTFILGEVSKKVAQYDSLIKVPHFDPVVMTVCKEVVKQSYMEAGRPDSFREDINSFISNDQFSYAASVDGMISREKPAACFFMGHFMAESLLMAEVGATSGAIQIAGTEQEAQLPFFFTACDYTLLGEELYAAGAYLSREPMLLSVLKVQDFGKLVVIVSVFFGSLLVILGAWMGWDGFVSGVLNLFKGY